MNRIHMRLVIAAAAAFASLGLASPVSTPETIAAREVARIRTHLHGALQMAMAADLSGYSAEQRAHRARLLAELDRYRARGVFPSNRDFPGQRVPYFVDAAGIRCAMAHLIESMGERSLVARIARTRNNARVRELADEPELIAWLDHHGLSVAEAARIQPEYGDGIVVGKPDDPNARYGLTSALMVAESGAMLLNAHRAQTPTGRAWRGVLGSVLGFSGVVAGLAAIHDDKMSNEFGYANVLLGTGSIALAARQLAFAPRRVSHASSVLPSAWVAPDGTRGVAVTVAF